MLSMCHAALFITSVAALLATLKANMGAENLPGALKNISEDVQTYFNHTKDSFQSVLIDNAVHSVIFYQIALSIQTCHMLMAEPSTYDMFTLFEKERLC